MNFILGREKEGDIGCVFVCLIIMYKISILVLKLVILNKRKRYYIFFIIVGVLGFLLYKYIEIFIIIFYLGELIYLF